MSSPVYLPADEFAGIHAPNLDLAADCLESRAALSPDGRSFGADIVGALELAADGELDAGGVEVEAREAAATGAVARGWRLANAP